jgi:hypothetical protein
MTRNRTTITSGSQARQAKARGRDSENFVVEYLRSRGYRVERRRLSGVDDCGDLTGINGLVCEIKSGGPAAAAAGLNELTIEVQNANARFPESAPHEGILIARRKGKPFVGEWYAIMRVDQFVDWLPKLGYAP